LAPDPRIQSAFLAACTAELAALKPGNVHCFADGHGMTVADFQASAAAAAPSISRTASSVGERILTATEATWMTVRCNTNLGIVLLCAPLALAAEQALQNGDEFDPETFARATRSVLEGLTVADAALAYRAIALANPGGLGDAATQDVRSSPTVTLRKAMELAAHRDRIASQYATGFKDIFDFALPALRTALEGGRSRAEATTGLYLAMLGQWADSHLLRKFGDSAAQSVSLEAQTFAALTASKPWPLLFEALLSWDTRLKEQGLNPGTTADLTVATLFVHHLLSENTH
jgi:triphosphoribosyl-dephospho-CoA synthase